MRTIKYQGPSERQSPISNTNSLLISPELKDVILRHLVEKYEVESIGSLRRNQAIANIDGNTLNGILTQFDSLGLIQLTHTQDSFIFEVKMEAHDFIQRGGFYGYELLFKSNVEKLLIELEKLQAVNPSPKNYDLVQAVSGAVQAVGVLYGMNK